MYLCGIVCWDVCCRGKVEGTMRYYARNQWDFGIKTWHCCTKGQTRALWDCHFGSWQFCRFLLQLKVFRSILHLNIFMIKMPSTVMQLFRGSYFIVTAGSRHLWPNSAIVNSTTYMNYVSTASKWSTKNSFQRSTNEALIIGI